MEVSSFAMMKSYFEAYRKDQQMPEGLKKDPFLLTKLFFQVSINEQWRNDLPPGELKNIFNEILSCALSNKLSTKNAEKIHRIIQIRDLALLENTKILFR